VNRSVAIFTGPSLPRPEAGVLCPGARIEPPVARGDIDRLRGEGVSTFLLIDGSFAHRLAIPPSEVVAALRAGARVAGTASLGAIRAVECWPAGMEGRGAVYRLFRWRVISDDDEVAVATDPEHEFAAVSVALINVRFAVIAALRRRLLDRESAGAVLGAARSQHFSQRSWAAIFDAAGIHRVARPELWELCERTDIKRRDALDALGWLAAAGPEERRALSPVAIRPARALGHHRYLGYSAPALRPQLERWLLASGRYRRYLERSLGAPGELWEMLERTGALDGELLRWHAVREGTGRERLQPTDLELAQARETLARGHGFAGWSELSCACRWGVLPDGVPIDWVRAAARDLARARRGWQG
jgi:hypothetical protein